MEPITDEKQLQSATSETSKTPSNTLTDYRSTIGRLILKSRLACSLPALDKRELAAQVEAWSEVLIGTVPESRLETCYLWAMKHRDTTFAMGAPEIVRAWLVVAEAERYRPATAVLGRMLKGEVCTRCNGTGTEIVRDSVAKTTSARPCEH